jgi:hypothetical protein
VLAKRLEDIDYRIMQYRRSAQEEARMQRRRDALVKALGGSEALLGDLTRVLRVEEGKLGHGAGLFHKGVERMMIEDLVAVENVEVFKAAGTYSAVRYRISDIEEEMAELEQVVEQRRPHGDHRAMLEQWRAELYDGLDLDARAQNALLHQRLDVELRDADLEDDARDLAEAADYLEAAMTALEDAITSGTRVRDVSKRDLAVVANLQPARSRQFHMMEMVHSVQLAYRTAAILVDRLQGIEHLQVRVREPERALADFLEALLMDHYEGGPPKHALGALKQTHQYLLQVLEALRARLEDVGVEREALQVRDQELFRLAVDARVRRVTRSRT